MLLPERNSDAVDSTSFRRWPCCLSRFIFGKQCVLVFDFLREIVGKVPDMGVLDSAGKDKVDDDDESKKSRMAMQRDYKLSSYSLNSVFSHFLSEQMRYFTQ
ncbi:hypothetical protein V6N13_116261 [Hibiscus sabdariffa]|uniref:Uncharacterized protein n=2 Tax=Hibiscus sabdariffa TaxID=183260 RepID=A0ABR2ANM3_9ROSI